MNTNSQCSLLTVYPNSNDPILSKLTESYIVITERDHQVVVNLLARLELIYKGLSAHYLGPTTISNPKVDPYAYGSYSYWKPGQYTLFAGFENVTENNIHFAGEGCSLKHQGYMEGAAEEGIRVANEIMNQKNLRTRHQLSKL
jgi:monoamine oxidase